MTFSVLSAADVPARASRTSKTTPLRLALAALEVGQAIYVAFDSSDPEGGYRPTTISQVAGAVSAASPNIRYSVRRKADGNGCYIIANEKGPESDKPKSERKPRAKRKAGDVPSDGTADSAD